MRKQIAVAAMGVLLFTACAAESSMEGPQDAIEASQPADPQDNDGDKKEKDRARSDKKKTRQYGGGGHSSKNGGRGDDTDGAASTGQGDGSNGGGNEDGGGPASAAPYPAAGTYTFEQSGYEEFCDSAGRCERERLPARQPLRLAYQTRSRNSAVVVSEQKASASRLARTWTKYTRSGAHIMKVYIRFEYSGFRLERTYVPEPAVEAFRFPFQAGAEWSGSWRASTSGSYRIRVGSSRDVAVGGEAVTAYPVETTTEFRGDFEGRSRITTYVDPRSKAVIAAEGVLNVTNQFGRYTTVFNTRLLSGPGY